MSRLDSSPRRRSRANYKHVISLGFFCSTALELERYGFREASYPLDWVISPLAPALTLLESEFKGLLQPDQLSRDSERNDVVFDMGSGIAFFHDFNREQAVEEQVNAVQEKYSRRVLRLYRAMTQRTLFVRYIANAEEFAYLDKNMNSVLMLLRRSNPLNDLLLVGNSDQPPSCGGLEVFGVEVDENDTVAREFLRKNRQLRLRLLCLPYPLDLRTKNYLRYLRTRGFRTRGFRSALRRLMSSVLGEERLRQLTAWVRSLKS